MAQAQQHWYYLLRNAESQPHPRPAASEICIFIPWRIQMHVKGSHGLYLTVPTLTKDSSNITCSNQVREFQWLPQAPTLKATPASLQNFQVILHCSFFHSHSTSIPSAYHLGSTFKIYSKSDHFFRTTLVQATITSHQDYCNTLLAVLTTSTLTLSPTECSQYSIQNKLFNAFQTISLLSRSFSSQS